MTRRTSIAPCFALLSLACSDPEPAQPHPKSPVEAAHPFPRPDLLWEVDLSEETVEQMTLAELWQIGVEFLLWQVDVPEGTAKAEVHERLIEAKYHDVGHALGYTGDDG